MGLRRLLLASAIVLLPVHARAADKPEIAPPASWIHPLQAPQGVVAQDNAAMRILLRDMQFSLTPTSSRQFTSTVIRIQKPEALTALGTYSLAWKPDTDRITVHWLRIRRGSQVIDVLGQQSFTILRREQNLEAAALDGILTATLSIRDLQVGDVIENAWSLERSEPLLQGHHDLTLDAGSAGNPAKLGLSAQWPKGSGVAIKSRNLPTTPVITPTGFTLTADDVAPLVVPQGAPLRYRLGRLIELSDFADWSSVSATFAPLYADARKLRPDSPLQAEIARIKAASSDPVVRAGLALQLVEEKVRYLFVGLNDGNLRPTAADETWQRRFGDCKAKTVLLLALLDGLGIAAEPALVSVNLGDGLDQRLPNASQFDHVIVRALIGGKVAWLDGTRLGDRAIADLEVPNFRWALPLREKGGALERLVVPPKTAPQTVFDVRLDASKGLLVPARAHVEATFTGDAGVAAQASLANVPQGALEQRLREYWLSQYDFITPDKVSHSYDPATRTDRLVMDGTARMAWNPTGQGQRYELDGAHIGWHGDFRRQPGPDSDAPFSLVYPNYTEYRETLVLPQDGAGFALEGQDVDRTLAGFALYRSTRLEGNRVTLVARQRPLVNELPYAEAQAANDALRTLSDGTVNIVIDETSYLTTPDDAQALLAIPLDQGEDGYRRRAFAYQELGDSRNGLALAQKYVAAFPGSAEALGVRAIFAAALGQDDAARADAKAALAIKPSLGTAKLVGDYYQSVAAGEKDERLGLFAWLEWGAAVRCTERQATACAKAHAERAIARQPDASDVYVTLANIYRSQGNRDAVVAVADRMVATAPRNPYMLAVAGVIYGSEGQRAKALATLTASLAIKPTVTGYLNRIRYMPREDLAGQKKDIDAALALDPDERAGLAALADWQGRSGDHAGAAATLQKLADRTPTTGEPDMPALTTLAAAYAAAGQADKARERFAEVRGFAAAVKNGGYFNNLCYQAATVKFDLETALADCNRAVALLPNNAAVLDSLGFVQLRLGHWDEALAAYDRALVIAPAAPKALYGRAIAHARKGDKTKAEADFAAAARHDDDIAAEFAELGLKP